MDKRKERMEENAMSSWYVSYRADRSTVMSIARTKDEAIIMAGGMLDRGLDVQEIGPLIEMPDGQIINAAEIRKIHAARAHELVGS
jgi:hypothetical protein